MSSFRHERLLEVKEILLDQKKRELEGAIVAVTAVVEQIAELQEEVIRTYAALTEGCITGRELSVLTGYLSYLDKRKDALDDEKRVREERVELLRQELLNLEIERKMFEKLKLKTLRTAKKTHNRKEQKFFDELAIRAADR